MTKGYVAMNKRALICGVSSQDVRCLAQLLLAKGYTVWGTLRDAQGTVFGNLVTLGILGK
jgi:GDPmannose 4,6-dehydratase